MLKNFIDFTQSLFPAINPYVQNQTKKALDQFKNHSSFVSFINQKPYDFLAQGDIFNEIPFIRQDKSGNLGKKMCKAILLSNTCSADHDNEIVLAPMFKIEETGLELKNVSDNLNYRLMYLPDEKYKEYVIDFSLLNTFNKHWLNDQLEKGEILKESSLNQFGFYFFMCKLTINFMRPEDVDVQGDRELNFYTLHTS